MRHTGWIGSSLLNPRMNNNLQNMTSCWQVQAFLVCKLIPICMNTLKDFQLLPPMRRSIINQLPTAAFCDESLMQISSLGPEECRTKSPVSIDSCLCKPVSFRLQDKSYLFKCCEHGLLSCATTSSLCLGFMNIAQEPLLNCTSRLQDRTAQEQYEYHHNPSNWKLTPVPVSNELDWVENAN